MPTKTDPNQEFNEAIPPVEPNEDLLNSESTVATPPVTEGMDPEQIASAGLSNTYSSSNSSTDSSYDPLNAQKSEPVPSSVASQPEQTALSAQDELLQPAGTVGSIQDLNPSSNPATLPQMPKRSLKKSFIVGVPILILVLIIGVVGFFVMQSGKTSKETLNSFSDASSGIGSKSTLLSTEISKLTYGAEQSSNIEQVAKEYDDAIKKFEEATAGLKSDKEALKLAAEEYVVQLKNFKDATVVLAVENAKIRTEFKKFEEVVFNEATTSSLATYTAEVDRISGEYAKISQLLKDVELTNPKAKELRDSYVAYLIQLQAVLKEIKTAVTNLDTQAIAAAQTKVAQLENDNAATAKEKEVDNLLGLNSEARKKLETARQKLNEEIAKVNS
jgi:hypothetical protein